MGSLKQMAPIFHALDRTTYLHLVPHHLAEMVRCPSSVLQHLKDGGFVASFIGNKWKQVAMDEALEMGINRETKPLLHRTDSLYIQRVSLILPFRCRLLRNVYRKIKPSTGAATETLDATSKEEKSELNIRAAIVKAQTFQMLPNPEHIQKDRGLVNPFTGEIATAQQQTDLLAFRTIGTESLDIYYSSRLMMKPSTSTAPRRSGKPHTFAKRKVTKRMVKQIERDHKIVTQCLKSRLAYSQRTNTTAQGQGEQYNEVPLAIATPSHAPRSGTKSYVTQLYRKRWPQCFITGTLFPDREVPDLVVIDGMFVINTAPLMRHTFADYASFLARRYGGTYFSKGVRCVDVVFDHPNHSGFSLKQAERDRRDGAMSGIECGYKEHGTFTSSSSLPSKWQEFLKCRVCKCRLVVLLCDGLLRQVVPLLKPQSSLITAGGFEGQRQDQAWSVTIELGCQPHPELTSSWEEADMRIWLFATKLPGSRVLIYSPDTDVSQLGLTLNPNTTKRNIHIQMSPLGSSERLFLHLNSLSKAIAADPDLAVVPHDSRQHILQVIYIFSGCDYTSYWAGLGKTRFLNAFFANAAFITGSSSLSPPGSLHNITPSTQELGFLAAVRLIGTVYLKKHTSAFPTHSPQSLFKSLDSPSITVKE